MPDPVLGRGQLGYLDVVNLMPLPNLVVGMHPFTGPVVAGFLQEALAVDAAQQPHSALGDFVCHEKVVLDWLFCMAGCDLVGMTNVPEVFLAREAQMNYATIGMVTDYDCWMEDPQHHVSVSTVISRYGESLQKAQQLLLALLATELPPINAASRESLTGAVLTPEAAIPESKRELLKVLKA